jgi:PAS domain-containing protein
MNANSLARQLEAAKLRFASLQRRAGEVDQPPRVLHDALRELEAAIEELRVSHGELQNQSKVIGAHREELRLERARYLALLNGTPQPLVVTNAATAILESNRPAAELLNISTKYLKGKPLSVFAAEDRPSFLRSVAAALEDGATRSWKMRLRPRERSVVDVIAHVKRIEVATSDGAVLQWILAPEINGQASLNGVDGDEAG